MHGPRGRVNVLVDELSIRQRLDAPVATYRCPHCDGTLTFTHDSDNAATVIRHSRGQRCHGWGVLVAYLEDVLDGPRV